MEEMTMGFANTLEAAHKSTNIELKNSSVFFHQTNKKFAMQGHGNYIVQPRGFA